MQQRHGFPDRLHVQWVYVSRKRPFKVTWSFPCKHLFLFVVKLFPKFSFLVRSALASFRTEQCFCLSEFSLLLMSQSWYELFRVLPVTVSASLQKEVGRCRYVKGDWVAEMWEFHSRWRSNYRGSVIEVLKAVEGVVVNFRVKIPAF
jgi:hypothetical protein